MEIHLILRDEITYIGGLKMNLNIEGQVTLSTKDYHRLLDMAEKGMKYEQTMQKITNTLDQIKSDLERPLYNGYNAHSDLGRMLERMKEEGIC